MKLKTEKQRRQINIPKTDYETIKNFCDNHALDMPKWIVLKIMEVIKNYDRQ